MNIALVMTAVQQGCVAANHTEVVALHKDGKGRCNGARLRDNVSGEEWNVKAKARHNPFRGVLRDSDFAYLRVSSMRLDPSAMAFASSTILQFKQS
jgi:hypothetical protein